MRDWYHILGYIFIQRNWISILKLCIFKKSHESINTRNACCNTVFTIICILQMPDSVQSNTRNAAALPAGGAGGTRFIFSSFPCTLKIHTFIVPSNPTFGASTFQVSFVPLGPRQLLRPSPAHREETILVFS